MIDHKFLYPSQDDIKELRKELYDSKGKGYYIFRNYIPQKDSSHMLSFWSELVQHNQNGRQKLTYKRGALGNGREANKSIYLGCPNHYSTFEGGGASYFNYFWNCPHDLLTHQISFGIQVLRNMVENKPYYNEIYPNSESFNCAGYSVYISKKGEIITPPHRDWNDPPYFEPERLQATLLLSKKGVDYTGQGFMFKNNQGVLLELDSPDWEVNPGDLILWRYNNEHSVVNVRTEQGQRGFARILFPPHYVFMDKPNIVTRFESEASEFFFNLPLVRKMIHSVYRPLKRKFKNATAK